MEDFLLNVRLYFCVCSVRTKPNHECCDFYTVAGLFLSTKLDLVTGTEFFPNRLKNFPIDLKLSQLAEKYQIKG